MKKLLLGLLSFWLGAACQAAPFVLADAISCNTGTPANGIAVTDVTGNFGGASNCWGAYTGSDPGPGGDGFLAGTTTYDYVAKLNTGSPPVLEGANIGLSVSPAGGSTIGTWEFNSGALGGADFLIVLKAANDPGFATWLFAGAHAASFMGDFLVAWGKDLSHLSVYKTAANGGNVGGVPEPATLILIGLGLLCLRRRRRGS